jgi:hypothetical protein
MVEQKRELDTSVRFCFSTHTIKAKPHSYSILSSECGVLHGVPLGQRPSLLSPQAPPWRYVPVVRLLLRYYVVKKWEKLLLYLHVPALWGFFQVSKTILIMKKRLNTKKNGDKKNI